MARDKNFQGSLTALLTPMTENGDLDLPALTRFIDWQIENGTSGLIPAGTTGESPTLSHEEHALVVAHTVEASAGRVGVMAGAGSNSTHEAIGMARHAQSVGADALLVVAPYYNKPGQEGLYRHYMSVADATDLPLYIYNVPGRSGVEVLPETIGRLARHPNIVGVKDATANLVRPIQVRLLAGREFNQLSGEDGTIVSFLAAGGNGCISVTSNVAPALCAQLHAEWQAGNIAAAMAIQDRLMPLHDALFCETNPIPVKYAASRLGLCRPTVRLPMTEPSVASRSVIDDALRIVGLME
ncbi:dihydrodipicolinate synthase [Neoasaia chiangmaiensis NBRC 101099]|uniref:4-hydroxy-tetrahydrodipicolinate synthase n=1 Tax=Neoasaia chiangmaiensis TaxID=320497 RepID=A0A1U9KMS8_9PROT|nr:4-hydroxy-tetrahydrodipicolinate synthase [Neoasaia chiangmaiensis]AQS87096.1 4-hydroxy-tetrahydrodipicolinate synthase [Neoasaia chiangmaiensis]GBR38043.1 dihydrodipicolinate synthase [Neoasaia chiangmaiensis NBRC 101099]GEN15244.1 4-hydroxy-tetrahydrodipicolinate synthase [Neoasaia chiangmaiensis]